MKQWHCQIGRQKYGPVGQDVLQSWIAQGRVSSQDLVWSEGMAQWVSAGSIPELSFAVNTAAAAPGVAQVPGALAPHRGGTVLALGILGICVCCICGIIAWTMGNNDLRSMAAGTMDRSGEQLTRAGKICGIIGTLLTGTIVALQILFMLTALIAGAAAG